MTREGARAVVVAKKTLERRALDAAGDLAAVCTSKRTSRESRRTTAAADKPAREALRT
jgi:hypothetical protein